MKISPFFKIFTFVAVLSLLLSACRPSAGSSVSIAKSDMARVTSLDAPSDETEALVQNNNDFAFDLYQPIKDLGGNIICSPYSISLALAMTYAGARGETEAQTAHALHFLPQGQLHQTFNALDLQLAERGKVQSNETTSLQLNIVNAVWAEQSYPFLQSFLDTIALNYGAGVRLVDLINKHEEARQEINTWVSDQTQSKIKDLIPQDVLDTDTRMALVNAIYFKADWLSPFNPDSTYDAPFHQLDGADLTVPTMNQDAFTPYAKGDGWQAVELPYQGATAAMDIIVPDAGRFEEFEASLDQDKVSTILESLQPTSLQVALPKFKFDSEFSVVNPLTTLGMTDAFDPEKADFSNMSEKKDLYISAILHKAFVAVDEKGTEAAAATAVIVDVSSAQLSDVTLTIDHPFIFLIRDIPTGQILFIGRVLNPTE